RELISFCETISSDEHVLSPMIIIPRIIQLEPWYTTTSIIDNYLVGTSESGYSNDELSMKWLAHFELHSLVRQAGTHHLLLLDGFDSQCTKQLIDFGNEHQIIIFCLPPHTSHLLQPLNVVFFHPYKYYHVEAATHTGCEEFEKLQFLDKIDPIHQQTFTPSTIHSTFWATGLIPYNSDTVISKF
ncbi:hypothetical protein L873DRAFT_1677297, partial [Choiromyces venosus 120613-1]